MYKFLVAICFVCTIHQDYDSTIIWDSNYRLQWKDFKSSKKTTSSERAAAVTASGISFGFSAKQTKTRLLSYDYHVISHFYPEKSWYFKGKENDVILEHERLHFDITELFARKLRKRIENTTFTLNIKNEMNTLNRQINEELKEFQEQYDFETQHSIRLEAQKKWEKDVALQLMRLNYYK